MDLRLYYTYVCVLAFYNKLKYGNSRTIKVNQLENYFVKYMHQLITFEMTKGKKISVIDEGEDEEHIDDIYPEIFYFNSNKNVFGVYSNITIQDLNKLLAELSDEIDNESIQYMESDTLGMLKLIGATQTMDDLARLLKHEKSTEEVYYDYLTKPNDEKYNDLKKRFFTRAINNINFSSLPDYMRDAYFCNSVDLALESKPYSIHPICRDAFNNFSEEDRIAMFETLDDIYMNAILGKESLNSLKVNESLSYASDKDASDYKRGVEYFFLRYINNIDRYNSNHERNESLNISRKRLLYALDDESLFLFMRGNLDSKISEALYVDADYAYTDRIKKLMNVLVLDLLMYNSTVMVPQKLLLMKTYYEVTHDEELKAEFERFIFHPLYDKYRSEVFGLEKTKKL